MYWDICIYNLPNLWKIFLTLISPICFKTRPKRGARLYFTRSSDNSYAHYLRDIGITQDGSKVDNSTWF